MRLTVDMEENVLTCVCVVVGDFALGVCLFKK